MERLKHFFGKSRIQITFFEALDFISTSNENSWLLSLPSARPEFAAVEKDVSEAAGPGCPRGPGQFARVIKPLFTGQCFGLEAKTSCL